VKISKTTFTIGLAHEEVEMNLKSLNQLLSGSTIHASFITETFFKLKDGQLIKMYNDDIERFKIESRDLKINDLIK
jgi:hypothetical protein